jgi:hypothetical protein
VEGHKLASLALDVDCCRLIRKRLGADHPAD